MVVAVLEGEESGAQLLDGLEMLHPEELLLEGFDESFGDPIALRFSNKRGTRSDAQEAQLVLEGVAHELAAVVVPQASEPCGDRFFIAAELLTDALAGAAMARSPSSSGIQRWSESAVDSGIPAGRIGCEVYPKLLSVQSKFRQEVTWPVALVGGLLALTVTALTLQAYFGMSPLAKLRSVFPSPISQQLLGDQGSAVILYSDEVHIPLGGTRVLDSAAQPLQLLGGSALVLDRLGDLIRMNAGGTATKMIGHDGQRIRVANLGPWHTSRGQLTGLDAVYRSGRWLVDEGAMHPANPNARLQLHDPNGLPTGFWASPGDAHYSISWSKDSQGSFAHIQATGANPYLVLNTRVPLNELNDVPITVRGEIRARCSCVSRLTVYDIVNASGEAKPYQAESGQKDGWITLTATVPRVKYPNDGDNFSLGLFNLGSGDSFDVRSVSLFEGVVP